MDITIDHLHRPGTWDESSARTLCDGLNADPDMEGWTVEPVAVPGGYFVCVYDEDGEALGHL